MSVTYDPDASEAEMEEEEEEEEREEEATEEECHACASCERTFPSSLRLKAHQKNSRSCGSRPFPCVDCGHRFGYPKDLLAHRNSPTACQIIQRRNQLQALVEQGQTGLPSTPSVSCPKCSVSLSSAAALQRHLREAQGCGEAQGEEDAQCPKCHRSWPGLKALGRHIAESKTCGTPRFACQRCGLTFMRLSALSSHKQSPKACDMQLQRQKVQRMVEESGQSVEESPRTAAALPEAEANEAGELECPKRCGSAFRDRSSLVTHLGFSKRCGDRANRYPCPNCGYAFAQANQLARHTESATACQIQLQRQKMLQLISQASPQGLKKEEAEACEAEATQHRCPRCENSFANSTGLRRHLESEKACEMNQRRKRTLEAISGGPKEQDTEVTCPKCAKPQRNRGALQEHLRVSKTCGDSSARFQCGGCGSAFAQLYALSQHKSGKGCLIQQKRRAALAQAETSGEDNELLRCPNCAFLTTQPAVIGSHVSRPKACKVQNSRVFSLSVAVSSTCQNCDVDCGSAKELMEHLSEGSECLKMRRINEPVVAFLERKLREKASHTAPVKDEPQEAADEQPRAEVDQPTAEAAPKARCHICAKTFPRESALSVHRRRNPNCA